MRLGVKAAPRDVATMRTLDHATFVETVLWGDDLRDLDATAAAYADCPDVVVHAPFTVPGGGDVDVAAADPDLRARSLAAWDATFALADRLEARWVVLHPGGIAPARDGTGDDGGARADAIDRLEDALEKVTGTYGRERLLLENMPAHYHRSGGATDRALIGQGVVDLVAVRDLVAGICLDVSHAWLTPGAGHNLDTFFRRADQDIKHLHLSDARLPDHEGLQFGDGDIPWAKVRDQVRAMEEAHGPVTGVPEVKGGHADGGAGFRVALDFLATHF